MKQATRFAATLAMLSGALLVGCVSTLFTASTKVDADAFSRVAPEAVTFLKDLPSTPYLTLGEIEAQVSGFPSDESILSHVRERAASVGANAVIYASAGYSFTPLPGRPTDYTLKPTALTFTAIRLSEVAQYERSGTWVTP